MIYDDDLIAGWRYSATLQLRTPLSYLQMDGEFIPGRQKPPLVGPALNFLEDGTGFNPYGIWLPVIDYKALGFPPPPESKRAAAGGMVRVGSQEEREVLSFLRSFRYIVETGETLDQMLSELEELSSSSPGNRRMWNLYLQADPLWPDSYFIGELEIQLPKGVGPSKAERLYLAGFRTVEEINAASDAELLHVEGLGKGLLRKLRAAEP